MFLYKMWSLILFFPYYFMDNKKLRKEVKRLRDQYDNLIRNSKANEKKQALLDSIGLEILSARHFWQLCEILLSQTAVRFQWHKVVLVLINNGNNEDKLIDENNEIINRLYKNRIKLLDPAKDSFHLIGLKDTAQIGADVLVCYDWILSDVDGSDMLVSAAYLPLKRNGKIIGILLLASRDTQCLKNGSGTDLLCKFADMVTVAIDNCSYHNLNRHG